MKHIKPMWENNASVGFAGDCTAGEVKVLAVCQLKRAPRQPIAALYVEAGGGYYNQEMVDPWDELRDARNYRGPFPVVAHPPCQRWGKYWHGAPNKPHQYRMGEDGGCFAAALTAARNYGGVVEHPAYSRAWRYFGLATPARDGGWVQADEFGGWTCHVEQGHYGHLSRKATWLYAVRTDRPDLIWGPSEQKIHPVALARYGYEKARRIGMMAMVGGKDKTRIRNATPERFRALHKPREKDDPTVQKGNPGRPGHLPHDALLLVAGCGPGGR